MTDRLRRAVRTRDAFLQRVASKLQERVDALAKAKTPRARRELVEGLQGFAAELSLIAAPQGPVPLALRRLELGAFFTRLFAPERCAEYGIVAEATRGGPAIVGRWDPSHLESIVAELVSNAMKYGGAEPVTVRVEAKRGKARIVVSNAGSWSGPAGRIDRFRREERRATVRGFGVGLWLARRLARAHGGSLSFDAMGGASRAIVSLPATSVGAPSGRFEVRLTPAGRRA